MSSENITEPNITNTPPSSPPQNDLVLYEPPVEILREDPKTGHHFLKVMSLTKGWNINGWRVDYDKVSNLPKTFLDSFIGPYVSSHANTVLTKLADEMIDAGKTDAEINIALREKSKELKIGDVLEHFEPTETDDENLWSLVEITDEKENDFIRRNKTTTKEFTSPGINGTATFDDFGRKIYNPKTATAFHISAAENPAFGKEKARIKAVCEKGSRSVCKRELAFASIIMPHPVQTESINTNPPINTNMNNSANNSVPDLSQIGSTEENKNTQVSHGDIVDKSPENTITNKKDGEIPNLNDGKSASVVLSEKDYQELIALRASKSDTDERIKKLEEANELSNKRYLTKLIETAIPVDMFEGNEELTKSEREKAFGFIKKYKMEFDDVEKYLSDVYSSRNNKEAPKTTEEKTKDEKAKAKEAQARNPGYGETLYDNESSIKGESSGSSVPSSSNGNSFGDLDFEV